MKDDQVELCDTDISTDISDVCPEGIVPNSPDNKLTSMTESSSNGFEENFSLTQVNNQKDCPAKDKNLGKRSIPDVDFIHPSSWSLQSNRICSTPQADVMKNRPELLYRRIGDVDSPTGVKGTSFSKSNPILFFNIPPELKADAQENIGLQTIKKMTGPFLEKVSPQGDDVNKIICDDFNLMKKKAHDLDSVLKSSDGQVHTETLKYQKIVDCYKNINALLENLIKDVNVDITTRDANKESGTLTKTIRDKTKESYPADSEATIKSSGYEKGKIQIKKFCEKFICTLAFSVEEKKREITAVSIEQMNRILYNHDAVSSIDIKHSKMSLSSGSLADHSSLSDSNSVQSLPSRIPYTLTGRHSIAESSSTSSSSSLQNNRIRHSHQFVAPAALEDKITSHHYRPKSCCCKCYCSLIKQIDFKTSHSLDSLTCTNDFLLESSVSKIEETTAKEANSMSKEEFSKGILFASSEKTLPLTQLPSPAKFSNDQSKKELISLKLQPTCRPLMIGESQSTQEKNKIAPEPSCMDFLVFARWLNKYYPGKVIGFNEEMWHQADHPLEVIFSDGKPKLLANVFVVPATLLPVGIQVMCDVGNNLFETGVLVKYERFINEYGQESLLFFVNIDDQIRTFPFNKVWFNEITKKNLGVTPRKPLVTQIGVSNLIVHGKRQRRSVLKTPIGSVKKPNASTTKKTSNMKSLNNAGLDNSVTTSAVNEPKSVTGTTSSQGQKRIKSSSSDSEDSSKKRSKFIKKLEFEPQPSTSFPKIGSLSKDIAEECKSSETELSDSNKWDNKVSDLDVEYIPEAFTAKKSLDPEKIKSCIKLEPEKENLVDILGPIRKGNLFKGYHFVLTHSERSSLISNSYTTKKIDTTITNVSSSGGEEPDSVTDVEDQLESCPPFVLERLKLQIKASGGMVYESVADVDKTEYSQTITISDYPCQTPNYLLSIALGIPIYRHDLIINCCKEDVPVNKMLRFSYYMPTGRSLETGTLLERVQIKKKPLKGYLCAINITSYKFWMDILTAMGATVISVNKNVIDCGGNISFILADENFHADDLKRAWKESIPVVSKVWVVQTLLHGEPRRYLAFPEYMPFHSEYSMFSQLDSG